VFFPLFLMVLMMLLMVIHAQLESRLNFLRRLARRGQGGRLQPTWAVVKMLKEVIGTALRDLPGNLALAFGRRILILLSLVFHC
jgi:hypothetical protein